MFLSFSNWTRKFSDALHLRSRSTLALLLATILVSGCGRDEIKTYRVPKEQPPRTSEARLPKGHPEITTPTASPRLKWKTPHGWKEVPPGEVRVASFKVTATDGKQADVSVIPLPGLAGGDLSNVNRWRGQVGQKPVRAEELKALAESVEVDGLPAALYDQSGENPNEEPTGILAVIQHRDGTAWFYKMTGDSQLVARAKPTFVEFLKSVRFTTGEAGTAQAASPPPSADKPQWVTPPGWKEVPGGQFLVAKFVITGEADTQAAVNVSSSVGDGGGVAANVNRWRKQLGLSDLSPAELAKSTKPIEGANGKATLVEMHGKDARSNEPSALVGAIVLQPNQAWFYKLMGDQTIVVAQKDAFIRFVQEVKY